MKLAFVTATPGEANRLASRAVESRVAACVNVVFGVRSHFFWSGERQTDDEALLVAKVPDAKTEEFVARIREWHSYQCPEVILIDVAGGNPDYISWVEDPEAGASDRER